MLCLCKYYLLFIALTLYPLVSTVAQSCLTPCRPHGLQHARLSYPSPTPEACSKSCPSSWWCDPIISSSVIPFFYLWSFPASGSFLRNFMALWPVSGTPSHIRLTYTAPGGAMVKNLPANTGDARDSGSIPGSGRSSGVGNDTPLQYSCLDYSMDSRA